jgi:hypothetical protein
MRKQRRKNAGHFGQRSHLQANDGKVLTTQVGLWPALVILDDTFVDSPAEVIFRGKWRLTDSFISRIILRHA